jgi:hypothetical protein
VVGTGRQSSDFLSTDSVPSLILMAIPSGILEESAPLGPSTFTVSALWLILTFLEYLLVFYLFST